MKTKRAPRRAFTLIELLVVIAIIAILAAILFPVFAQAKLAAKKTKEISSMKQVVTAAFLYVADNDDVNPQGDDYAEWLWPFLFAPYTKTNPQDWKKGGKDTIYWSPNAGTQPQYLAGAARVARVEELGLHMSFNLQKTVDPAGIQAYSFWSTVAINEASTQEWPNLSDYAEPSDTIYFTQAQDTEVEQDEVLEIYGRTQTCRLDNYPENYEKFTPRGGYNLGTTFAWIDGHVTYRKIVPGTLEMGASYDSANPEQARWCNAGLWQWPGGSGSGGKNNCREWSAPADTYEDIPGFSACVMK
ncbi:prepilin-type N-terminal cleavage/methylation domain-containing protein [bacterium]|nr:MAG: prepilin-type N-terminal cleavage/methylation domain-containing protein [bacterium]